jgi:Flp pilus assembly protein TadG
MRHVEFKKNRGQAMVEFALVLPILLLLLFGMIEFGRVFHEYLVVTHAAREGARVATLGGTDAEILSSVNIAADSVPVTVIVPLGTRVRGSQVTVTVTSQVPIITPLFSSIFPQNPFPVSGTSIMRVE